SSLGHVRFVLPLAGPLANLEQRPVGISDVVNDSGAGTGSVYFSSYFKDPSGTDAAGLIGRLDLGGEVAAGFDVSPTELEFKADVVDTAPPDTQTITIKRSGGGTL